MGIFLFLLLASTLAAASDSKPKTVATAKRPEPDVILITLDTTRADRMGFLGSKRGLTPHLDTLAAQGVVFSRAYSHVPLTTASHTTILTGTYPQFNHVNDFGKPLAANLPYLPELLHEKGYKTAAFVGSIVLDPLDGTAPGFDRGFDTYDAGFHMRARGADRYKSVERRADEVVARAMKWMAQNPRGPIFIWVHLYDAHDPYDPPEPYKTRYASEPYDGEIAYADSAVGKLFDALRSRGSYDRALIAVMADHGEALGEHGEKTHGIFLYDETIHVPLLFKLPGEHSAGKRVEARAGLVDVTPTILHELGMKIPPAMQGSPLLSANTAAADRPAYAETDYPHRAFAWSALRALRTGKYLYIQAPERELYDTENDPAAANNLAVTSRAVSDTLAAQLTDFRAKTAQTLIELAKPTPEQMQQLQALGYVASDTEPGKGESISGADPKGKIEIANLLHFAMMDVENARYQEAIPGLEKVIAEQPGMAVAQMQYGIAESRLKNYAKAIAPLQKAVQLLPDAGIGHYELGLALFETGDWKGAAPQFEVAVMRAPRWADAHFSLAAVYARIDRIPEAMTELDIALNISPAHYRANLLRGRILSLQGHAEESLPNLLKAEEVQPDSREAHLFLADAYQKLGRAMDAAREHQTANGLGVPKS